MDNAKNLFQKYGCSIVRYADDFVIMGKTITEQVRTKLEEIIQRMELSINFDKTRLVDATKTSFDFLGFTVRYDKDIKGRNLRYWNISPSKKSEKKIRNKISDYLKTHGHCNAKQVATDLNLLLRGWINYFNVEGVSYPAMSNRKVRFYLYNRLTIYYKRKSQRKCRLYRQNAFEVLVTKYGLIDPTKYIFVRT